MKDKTRPYHHAEAFALMHYATQDGSYRVTIWNSRDGVTPFIYHLPDGREVRHVDWHLDRCAPDYRPRPGEFIWADLSQERAERYARQYVAKWWEKGMRDRTELWPDREAAVASMKASYLERPGEPDLIEVPDPVAITARVTRLEDEVERLRAALEELNGVAFSGDEARLLLVGIGGSDVSPELHARCDRVAAALRAARAALEEANRE